MSAVAASAGSTTADQRGTSGAGGTGGPRRPGDPGSSGGARRSGRPQRSGGPQWPGDLPLPAHVLRPGDLLSADELPDGLVVADECGRVVIFNRAAERLTGFRARVSARGLEIPVESEVQLEELAEALEAIAG